MYSSNRTGFLNDVFVFNFFLLHLQDKNPFSCAQAVRVCGGNGVLNSFFSDFLNGKACFVGRWNFVPFQMHCMGQNRPCSHLLWDSLQRPGLWEPLLKEGLQGGQKPHHACSKTPSVQGSGLALHCFNPTTTQHVFLPVDGTYQVSGGG